MNASPGDGTEIGPRYFGSTTWVYATGMAIVFALMPPYPSSARGWIFHTVLAMVLGIGAALTEVWAARRTERKARAQEAAEAARHVLPKERT